MSICVVINTHKAYLPYLAKAIAAVDRQTVQPDQKILAYDGMAPAHDDPRNRVPDGWDVINENHGKPNPLRNAALEVCRCDWIIFADGDDEMHSEYVGQCRNAVDRVRGDVGIVYNDIRYVDQGASLRTPEWDHQAYWRLRQKNFISSTSCWRVKAIKDAGGWSKHTKCYDDYSLALEVTRRGWQCRKGAGVIMVRDHPKTEHRRKTGAQDSLKVFPHVWYHRTYTMLTLMAGRMRMLQPWANWIHEAHNSGNLPPNFQVIAVNDSRDEGFRKALHEVAADLPVPVAVHNVPSEVEMLREPITFARDRTPAHRHVARMYNYYLHNIDTDFLLMFEDDMVPPKDGLRKLAERWDYHKRPAGIGAVYLSRHNRDKPKTKASTVVASMHRKYWRCDVKLGDVSKTDLQEFRQIAGGFTLWNMGVLQLIDEVKYGNLPNGGRPYGWDTDLSRKCAHAGWKLYLAGDVFAEHKYMECDQ